MNNNLQHFNRSWGFKYLIYIKTSSDDLKIYLSQNTRNFSARLASNFVNSLRKYMEAITCKCQFQIRMFHSKIRLFDVDFSEAWGNF
jgi:hypothetical protein